MPARRAAGEHGEQNIDYRTPCAPAVVQYTSPSPILRKSAPLRASATNGGVLVSLHQPFFSTVHITLAQPSARLCHLGHDRVTGLRSPHKLKSAVSGCVRECAEAQGKDFGLVATENGYNLYVCGNGGAVARSVASLAFAFLRTTLRDPTLVYPVCFSGLPRISHGNVFG